MMYLSPTLRHQVGFHSCLYCGANSKRSFPEYSFGSRYSDETLQINQLVHGKFIDYLLIITLVNFDFVRVPYIPEGLLPTR